MAIRSVQKTQTTCLILLAIMGVGFSLYFLQSVLLPFVIALFVVIGCRPILQFFERRLRLPKYIAFAATFLIGVLALAAFGFVIWASINDVARNAGAYEQRLGQIATWVSERIEKSRERQMRYEGRLPETGPQQLAKAQASDAADNAPRAAELVSFALIATLPGTTLDGGGIVAATLATTASTVTEIDFLAEKARQSPADPGKAIQDLLDAFSTQLQSLMLGLAASLSTLLSYGVLILIFVFFLLIGNGASPQHRPQIVNEVEDQVRRYLVMKTVISFFTGFAFGGVLWLFGVPLAVVFGFLAFLLNFIPNIGPLMANLLPVPFLILNSQMSTTAAIVCLILISAIQFVSGNVIETRLMGKSFDVSPVVLLVALMFFGLVWGIVGMFLATPIVSIIKIVLSQSPETRPGAELLAGRWSSIDDLAEVMNERGKG